MEINPFWIIFCIVAPLVGIAIFAWGFLSERRQNAKKIEKARSNYENALAKLQRDPQSEEAFQEALRLGQAYADLVMFDERDSFNDTVLIDQLNAARPGRERLTSLEEAGSSKSLDPAAEQLAELEELRRAGQITTAKYQQKLAQILDT